MSCDRGRTLHADFTKAVAQRSLAERLSHLDLHGEVRRAKKREDLALFNRSIHITACGECWVRPPK
jgi:hypothetical protein